MTLEQYEERVPQIPLREPRIAAKTEDITNKSPPYFLRGRDREIVYLARMVQEMPRPIRLIMGPPGSGKSSLLTYVRYYCEANGYAVVELEHAHFASDGLLAAQIEPSTGFTQSEVKEGATKLDVVVASHQESEGVAQHQIHLPAITNAIISRATAKGTKGLVILIDEFQKLKTSDSTQNERVKKFLDFLHSKLPQLQKVPALCIGAGLLDSLDVAADLGLTRITRGDCIYLNNVSQPVAMQILRDHLADRIEGSDSFAAVADEHITSLAATTEGYPHHITSVGHILQAEAIRVRRDGAEALDDEVIESVVQKTAPRREMLYEARLGTRDPEELGVLAIMLADLHLGWPNGIPDEIVQVAVNRFVRWASARPGCESLNKLQVLRSIQRIGLLEERGRTHIFPSCTTPLEERPVHPVWHMPIPSLSSYIYEHRLRLLGTEEDLPVPVTDLFDAEAVAKYGEVRPWQWSDQASAEDVVELPVVSASAIERATGMEYRRKNWLRWLETYLFGD